MTYTSFLATAFEINFFNSSRQTRFSTRPQAQRLPVPTIDYPILYGKRQASPLSTSHRWLVLRATPHVHACAAIPNPSKGFSDSLARTILGLPPAHIHDRPQPARGRSLHLE